jgi:hypothetical protein
VPETTPLPIAEIPAPKAKRGRPRKSEVRPPIPLPNGDRLVPRKQQAALLILFVIVPFGENGAVGFFET